MAPRVPKTLISRPESTHPHTTSVKQASNKQIARSVQSFRKNKTKSIIIPLELDSIDEDESPTIRRKNLLLHLLSLSTLSMHNHTLILNVFTVSRSKQLKDDDLVASFFKID